jgi:tRNA 2-thiouridine synthesizing protein A
MKHRVDWKHDRAIDTCGLKCPLPVLKARKALLDMKPGERLLVEATDRLATIDMPHYCRESGNRLIRSAACDGSYFFLIEKA